MKVRVLGCSGAIAKDCRTTSFLINENILIDAGTGVGDLTLDEMCKIDHVFLTHSHLDHIAALPLMLDAVSSRRTKPLLVHALKETIQALQAHIFNNIIWPDFSVIPTQTAPFLQYQPFVSGEQLTVAGTDVEVLPARHTVPAVGFAVRGKRGWWAFSGDTERNPPFWARINSIPVVCLVIETAFSNRERELAQRSLHLAPETLAQELVNLPPTWRHPIYVTHIKPSETELIMQEIRQMDLQNSRPGNSAEHDLRWMQRGLELEI